MLVRLTVPRPPAAVSDWMEYFLEHLNRQLVQAGLHPRQIVSLVFHEPLDEPLATVILCQSPGGTMPDSQYEREKAILEAMAEELPQVQPLVEDEPQPAPPEKAEPAGPRH